MYYILIMRRIFKHQGHNGTEKHKEQYFLFDTETLRLSFYLFLCVQSLSVPFVKISVSLCLKK